MKHYLQEKGSMKDFLSFSNDKRDAFTKQLKDEKQRLLG